MVFDDLFFKLDMELKGNVFEEEVKFLVSDYGNDLDREGLVILRLI